MNRSTNNKKKNKSSRSSVDSEFLSSHRLTGSTTTLVMSDLKSKPQNFNIVQRPPRNFFTQTFWAQLSSADNIVVSSQSAVVESNVSPQANGFPGFAAFAAAFDQYCIYSCVMTVAYIQENSAVTSSVQNVIVHTAIDYDNVSNIGLAALQGYSTYSETQVAPNTSLVRFCKPCISSSQYTTSSTAQPSGVVRQWIDAAYNTIAHFGFRLITGITPVSTVSLNLSFTAVFGFRNGI
jgi:hypothetical protein